MSKPAYFKEKFNHHLFKITEKFIFIFLVILMFDGLYNMFLWGTGHFFKLIEYSLEVLAEYYLHTSDSQSEIITFYVIFAIGLGLFIYFIWISPRLLSYFYHHLQFVWTAYEQRSTLYWHHLSLPEKMKLSMTYIIEMSFIFFWLTM